jgi:proteasome lid subunit RPN8/RPN11
MEAHIPRHLINQILEQAQNSPTREVCGLISCVDQYPAKCYSVSNTAPDPEKHFLMDPEQQIGIMRDMRERNEELYAIYHSHPDSPARPSEEDLAQVAYPDTLHLIISMDTTGILQLNGFQIQSGRAIPVDVILC